MVLGLKELEESPTCAIASAIMAKKKKKNPKRESEKHLEVGKHNDYTQVWRPVSQGWVAMKN